MPTVKNFQESEWYTAHDNKSAFINTSTTTQVKSGKGVLHSIVIQNAGATSPRIQIYDDTSGTARQIADFNPPVVGSYVFDVELTTGLKIVTDGTTPPVLTVSYR